VQETERLNAAGKVAYHKAKSGLIRLYPHVLETIIATRENNGLRWGILTNGLIDKQWDKIMMLGLDPFVHPVVISEAVAHKFGLHEGAINKPNERFYDEAQTAVNKAYNPLEPLHHREILYLDDRLEGIMGANRMGWHTVHVPQGKYTKQNQQEIADKFSVSVTLVKPKHTIPEIARLIPDVLDYYECKMLV
jgi:FMN phosphatase YigB (HAD superfamily)